MKLYNSVGAAQLCGVSDGTIRDHASRGHLERVQVVGRPGKSQHDYLFTRQELLRWMAWRRKREMSR